MHTLRSNALNPYQQVISVLCDVLLARLDEDSQIPLYGFGDYKTSNRSVFMLNNEQVCCNKEELMCAYADAAAAVTLSGPTSFAPIINEAIDVTRQTGKVRRSKQTTSNPLTQYHRFLTSSSCSYRCFLYFPVVLSITFCSSLLTVHATMLPRLLQRSLPLRIILCLSCVSVSATVLSIL